MTLSEVVAAEPGNRLLPAPYILRTGHAGQLPADQQQHPTNDNEIHSVPPSALDAGPARIRIIGPWTRKCPANRKASQRLDAGIPPAVQLAKKRSHRPGLATPPRSAVPGRRCCYAK